MIAWLLRISPLLPVLLVACSCGRPPPPRRPPRRDPSVAALDRLLDRGGPAAKSNDEASVQACLREVEAANLCPAKARIRTLKIRLALDPRYTLQWGPNWEERLNRTEGCVNKLYTGTGLQWEIADIKPWDPGVHRHALYPLLERLHRDFPADLKSVVLGITVWEKRRIYAQAGGEIGLSQRAACVVPSWPRVENDCVILAHELGHLVGARHVPGKKWIMGWAARPFHLPAADPIARVIALYHFHPRNIEAIRMHAQAKYTPRGLRLPVKCKQRLEAIDRCWRL